MKVLAQNKDYNCAVYALHFLLGINGINYDIVKLESELGTNEESGTSHEQIMSWLKKAGIENISFGYNVDTDILRFKLPALVNYQYCDEDGCDGHYGVILTVNDKLVILYNPAIGEIDTLDRKCFGEKWYSERYGKGWFLKIN